jgi:Tfp pilus assembly protein PilF
VPTEYTELEAATALVKKGGKVHVEEGIHMYEDILSKTGSNAGVQYNLAMAYVENKDWSNAVISLEETLRSCSNYEPAGFCLVMGYNKVGGNAKKVAELRETFGWTTQETE